MNRMTILHTDLFVTLADPDGETLTKFYTSLFNLEPSIHIPKVYSEFQLPGLRLGIFKPKHSDEFVGRGGGMSLCVEVRDLEGAIAHLAALGYPPPGEIAIASHGREIYAYDPCGNRLILHQKT
jgi:predicted enzyme related to lactoylglutathione lyase